MSDEVNIPAETPAPPSNATEPPQETYVVSQKEIGSRVFERLVPNPMRPNSWVTLRRITEARKRQINDKYNVTFGNKPMNVKFGNSFQQQQMESFVDMGGWSTAPGVPLAATAENFVEYVASHQFLFEGEPTTVWTRCEALIDEKLFGVEKNS